MRLLWQVSLCCLLAGGIAVAQRGGGGMRGGGGFAGGMPGGMGGGNFGGFPGVFVGSANLHGGFGPIRGVYVGLPSPGFPTNGFASNNVSFPFGSGFPASPVGFPNGVGFGNFNIAPFRDFPTLNNGFGFNRGFNNGLWWGFGVQGIGTFPDSSYWLRSDYPYAAQYASYQPPNVAFVYPPEQEVQPLSAERARPVMHEYDQSGREIPSTSSPSPNVAAVQPAERGRGVIHEYDQSGREIPR